MWQKWSQRTLAGLYRDRAFFAQVGLGIPLLTFLVLAIAFGLVRDVSPLTLLVGALPGLGSAYAAVAGCYVAIRLVLSFLNRLAGANTPTAVDLPAGDCGHPSFAAQADHRPPRI